MAYFSQQQPQIQQAQQQQQDVVSGDQYRYALTNFVCFQQVFVCVG